MKKVLLILSIITFVFSAFIQKQALKINIFKEKLSDYEFFRGNLNEQIPSEGVLTYTLNTPLFSDYAEKLRFISLPKGTKMTYQAKEVFNFPIGTTIIKTFYFPNDFRNPNKGRRIIETRLLNLDDEGWKAATYIWNDEQTDAFLEVAGEQKEVSYIYLDGKKKKHFYSIPNLNQCKGCHNLNEKMTPIGPTARQLNNDLLTHNGISILEHWQKINVLDSLPTLNVVPKAPIWNKPETGSLNERARIWLDINCAHCHRPEGPASTSGLNLSFYNENKSSLGIMKTPVAAGRGSGNRMYGIMPTKPDESMLVYRIESTDPGIMMPEVGRRTTHQEGVKLIKEWIREMREF